MSIVSEQESADIAHNLGLDQGFPYSLPPGTIAEFPIDTNPVPMPPVSQGYPMDNDTIDNLINDANDIALSWYSVLSGKPLPSTPPPVSPIVYRQVVQQAADQSPLQTLGVLTPQGLGTVPGGSMNPLVIIGIAAVVIGLVYVLK